MTRSRHAIAAIAVGFTAGTAVYHATIATAAPTRPPATVTRAITAASIVYGFPINEAIRVARCESSFKTDAVSPTDDHGLFQLNRGTWARTPFARLSPYDPAVNALAAGWWWNATGRRWGARPGGWAPRTLRCAGVH